MAGSAGQVHAKVRIVRSHRICWTCRCFPRVGADEPGKRTTAYVDVGEIRLLVTKIDRLYRCFVIYSAGPAYLRCSAMAARRFLGISAPPVSSSSVPA